MAYALKYQIPFLSSKNETFLINLLLKDYTGTTTNLEGAPDPYLLNYESGDNDIINPIRASECTVNFYNNGSTPLTAFYSEDDEAWKIEFYRQTGNKLLWSGFLVQDDCRETFQDPPHIVSLKGTDNLALLKDIPFNEAWFAEPLLDKTSILDKYSLFDYIKYSLLKTGLGLTLSIYSNIYENSMPDRTSDAANDGFRQTLFYSGMFLNDDGTWANCYEILERILFPFNATLQQANGAWQIVRWPELRSFANNAIPGSAYDANFNILSAVTLAPNAVLAHGSAVEFINADATRSILRPYKNVKFTFNYQQPKSLINGVDLKITGALDHSDTIGTIRYDYYEIPSFWKHLDGDTSLIVKVTDIPTNTEIERYIYMPKFGDQFRFLRFNPVEVSQGDVFDFVCSFRHDVPTSQDDTFSIRFLLIRPDNNYYTMRGYIGKGLDYQPLGWAGPFPLPIPTNELLTAIFIDGGTDDSDWAAYSLTRIQQTVGTQYTLPAIPEDSVLLIDIAGGNGPEPSYADVEMLVKEMRLEFLFRINKSTNIEGQRHLNKIADNPKNKLEQEIEIDDAPRSSIAGALFTATLTTFGEGIGDIYFTKTKSWHRSGITESRRLGDITTMEREQIQSTPRAIMEGTIDYTNPLLGIMNVLQIDTLPNLNFIFGVTEFNFMQSMFKATLWEIHAGETDATMAYTFEYIYKIS